MPAARLSAAQDVGGVVGHMLEHQRAADLMLQGLVAPSTSIWREGAAALLAAPLRSDKLPPDPKWTPELRAAEARVHRLASDAVQATDSLARANFYAQILAHCSACHGLHEKSLGPVPALAPQGRAFMLHERVRNRPPGTCLAAIDRHVAGGRADGLGARTCGRAAGCPGQRRVRWRPCEREQ